MLLNICHISSVLQKINNGNLENAFDQWEMTLQLLEMIAVNAKVSATPNSLLSLLFVNAYSLGCVCSVYTGPNCHAHSVTTLECIYFVPCNSVWLVGLLFQQNLR